MSVMGTRVVRVEDPEFLTSGAVYTADLNDPRLENCKYAAYVRSTIARGKILSIDTEEAKSMDGVLGVHTASDFADQPSIPAQIPMFPEPMMNRPLLAVEEVRFLGEPVAVVVADSPAQAQDGVEQVIVDYEPLPAVVDLEEAAADKEIAYPDIGTNTAMDFAAMGMATGINAEEDIFAGCEVVVSQRVVNHKVAPAPLEGRSAACAWDGDQLVFWSSNQSPHQALDVLKAMYSLEPPAVKVITPAVGGGFGQKIRPTPEEALLPALSRQHGFPMRWTETRSENLLSAGHGRAQIQTITIGGKKDGKVEAYRLEILGDAGAYISMGGFLPYFTGVMSSGNYDIEKIETTAKSVITNTAPIVAYRGAGRPEATLAIERAIELFASEIGMDSAEIREKNLIKKDQQPFTTKVGTEYDTGDYLESMKIVLKSADYKKLRAEQADKRAAGDSKLMGIGLCCYVEVTAGPAPGGSESARVEITPEGKAKVYSGAMSHGQSHQTTFAMLASDKLGMPMEDIEIIQGDTELIPEGTGSFGSRSLQIGGSSINEASEKIAESARELASGLLEAKAEDIVVEDGKFFVAGTPAVSVSWAEVAASAPNPLSEQSNLSSGASYPYGTHLAVVEVDSETGEVLLKRLITCDDSGILLNPMIVEGQRHGGNAQGIAQALLEEIRYDGDGNLSTSNFADYEFISAAELPNFELETTETPTTQNPLGFKGIGESGAIGSTPAIQNAVIDALSHLGVKHIDIPCTPEKIWRTIQSASNS